MRLFLGTYAEPQIIYSNIDPAKLQEYWNCSMKFVEPENIHLTWKFIGNIEEDKVDNLINAVKECMDTSLDIKIKFQEFVIWPNGKFPRQLVLIGKDLNGDGAQLYKSLNNNLVEVGLQKEKYSFKPHITVARFRIKEKPKEAFILPEWMKFQETTMDFSGLSLIQSILSPKGSTYKVIESFNIKH